MYMISCKQIYQMCLQLQQEQAIQAMLILFLAMQRILEILMRQALKPLHLKMAMDFQLQLLAATQLMLTHQHGTLCGEEAAMEHSQENIHMT